MAKIYLIRHGETDWNVDRRVMGRSDIPLNPRGAEQADAIAEVMKSLPVDAVFSSPQLRARQTADAIAKRHGLAVEVAPPIAEVDFPRWQGKAWEELAADPVYDLYHRSPATARHEGFEAIADVYSRTSSFLDDLVRRRPEGSFALVSHADPLRTLVSYMLRQPLEEFRRFRFSNASLSVLGQKGERWVLTLFNYRLDPEWSAP